MRGCHGGSCSLETVRTNAFILWHPSFTGRRKDLLTNVGVSGIGLGSQTSPFFWRVFTRVRGEGCEILGVLKGMEGCVTQPPSFPRHPAS